MQETYYEFINTDLVTYCYLFLLQNGDGYVDSEDKMKKITESVAAALSSKWCCTHGILACYVYDGMYLPCLI